MTRPSTDPAAFEASYSDWKLIRTRKVVQLVLEVPIERADQAYQVLGGMPRPDAEIWVAVARLTDAALRGCPQSSVAADVKQAASNSDSVRNLAVEPSGCIQAQPLRTETYRAESHPPPEQGEASHPTDAPGAAPPSPRRFTSLALPQQAGMICEDPRLWKFVWESEGFEINNSTEASEWLRLECGVRSRRELSPDTSQGNAFIKIRDRFLAWKDAA